ncbi:hypothetical protein GCM10009823_10950 [Brevibacterium salitolerans]|uniref:Uncharacterized protein n=1 Tax=Brevibacterium salitolerans TaxID=1403566 RepID=A0ABP5I4F1_9MICO
MSACHHGVDGLGRGGEGVLGDQLRGIVGHAEIAAREHLAGSQIVRGHEHTVARGAGDERPCRCGRGEAEEDRSGPARRQTRQRAAEELWDAAESMHTRTVAPLHVEHQRAPDPVDAGAL